jgi:hypothetical protein
MLHITLPLLAALTPLTQIEPTDQELSAFAATVAGALDQLQEAPTTSVLHLLGASSTEAMVDWSPLCERGHKLVLVGPNINEQARACVTAVAGLWSTELLADHPHGAPDVIVLLNADLYMCEWRRTLAQLLQLRKPVVLTVYCAYEGAAMDRLLKWPEVEFAPAQVAQCDRATQQIYGSLLGEAHSAPHVGVVPQVRTLWDLAPNPHAHAPPKESGCRADSESHGVRNAYWMAFMGSGSPATEGKGEL